MDILQYSALKEQNDVCTCLCNQLPTLINNSSSQLAGVTQSSWWCWKERISLFVCPTMWYCGIPSAPPNVNTSVGATNSLRVCNTCTNLVCSACCLWTVPTGASFMRIQLWGAGAGTGSGCCCGGSVFGTTGAYASIIMPAVPGCQYTLCAGGSINCCANWGAGGDGAVSYAGGPGLCNFCAEGGSASLYYWTMCIGECQATTSGYKLVGPSASTSFGMCLCNACYDYCFSGSCGTCGYIPFLYAYNTYFGTPCGLSANSVVAGLSGIYRTFCSDTNHFINTTHPPIYGFDTLSQCSVYATSGTCCGSTYSPAAGYLAVPGAGGWFSHAMAGNTCVPGGTGRFGMVCVTWW